MAKRLNILISTDQSPFAAQVELAGMAAFATRLGTWRYTSQPDSAPALLEYCRREKWDGILGHLESRALLRIIRKRRIPAVMLNSPSRALPGVVHDHERIGEIAAEHLFGLGLRHLAYVGDGNPASKARLKGFSACLRDRGVSCVSDLGTVTPEPTWDQVCRPDYLRGFLARLKLPAGVLAFNDQVAISIVDAANEMGIAIPGQLAVMGADNNQLRCEFARIPLTSVDPDLYRVAYEAAALLHRIISGEKPGTSPILIPPRGLVCRQSTDAFAFDHPEFAAALAWLHEHALSGISVKEAMAEISMSRVHLERCCRQYLHRSPAQEVRRVRIEHACKLLAETDLKAGEISHRCGFEQLSHFSRVFSQAMGISPSFYRSRYQRLQSLR